jgi:hypothetical protein
MVPGEKVLQLAIIAQAIAVRIGTWNRQIKFFPSASRPNGWYNTDNRISHTSVDSQQFHPLAFEHGHWMVQLDSTTIESQKHLKIRQLRERLICDDDGFCDHTSREAANQRVGRHEGLQTDRKCGPLQRGAPGATNPAKEDIWGLRVNGLQLGRQAGHQNTDDQ